MSKKVPITVGPPLQEGSISGSHPDIHSLIKSLRDENNKLKKENETLRTLIPPNIKPSSIQGSVKGGSVNGGSVKGGSVKGGSVKGGSIQGGSVKGGSVQGGSVQGGSVKGESVKGGSIKGGSVNGGSVKGGSVKGGSVKGSDTGLAEEDDISERILQYPKVIFQISIESIHNLDCYITVWTKIRDKIAPIDSTETIKYNESLGVCTFTKIFEIPYLIGIDNNQMVIFEIFDGDTKQIRQGYYWASVSIKLPFIVRAESVKLDIMRGDDSLGSLYIKPALGSHEQVVSLKAAGTDPMLFFKPKKPSLDSIRAAIPTIKQTFAFYTVALKTQNICPVSEQVIGERGAIFMKICSNRTVDKENANDDQKKDSSDEDEGNDDSVELEKAERKYEEKPTSRNLVTLFTSSFVTKKPYDVSVLEIKFSHEDLTDDADLRVAINDNAELIFQIYLDGIYNVPKLVHYTTISVKDFIRKSKPDKKNRPIPFELNFREVFDLKSLEKKDTKSKKKDDDDNKSNDSFDDEIDAMSKPVILDEVTEEGKAVEEEDNVEDIKSSKSSFAKKPFIEIRSVKEKLEFELTTGDLLYEIKLRETLIKKNANWQSSLSSAFFDAWNEQTQSIIDYKSLMEASIDGWSLDVVVVTDLHFACLQHAAYKLNPDLADVIQVDSTYLGSSVIDTVKLVYPIIAPLLRDNAIRSFAGGGVGAPHSDYPSCSSCRHVGIPLVQEYLLHLSSDKKVWKDIKKRLADNLHFNSLCNTEDATENYIFSCENTEDIHHILDPPIDVDSKPRSTINPLISCLENENEFETWGGYKYVETCEYYNWAHLYSGMLEATSLYLPCLLASEVVDDSHSVKSSSKSVKSVKSFTSGMSSGSNTKTNTSLIQADISEKKRNKLRASISTCGLPKTQARGTELWSFIDEKFKTHSSLFDVDIEFINAFLLHRDKNEMPIKQSDVLLWVLGKCPPSHLLEALGAMIERHILSENKTALIIMLSAENRFDLDEVDNENINAIAHPFAAFLKIYYDALSRAKSVRAGDRKITTAPFSEDDAKYSKMFHDGAYNVCLIHFVTFKEIVMRSFLDMDKAISAKLEKSTMASSTSKAASKVGKSVEVDLLPTYGAVLNILKLFVPDSIAESIVGLDQIEENEDDEPIPDDSSAVGKAPTIGSIASNHSALGEKAKKLEENIDEQSEVLELKVKFDVERDEIIVKGISAYVASFVNRMKNEKEIYDKNRTVNKSCMDSPQQVLCPIT